MKKQLTLGLAALCLSAPAFAQSQERQPVEREEKDVRILVPRHAGHPGMPPAPPAPPMPPMAPLPPPAYGIPSHLVRKLGLPQETVKKVEDMTFEANEKLIGLEADLKRAQLALERLLRQPDPAEGEVMRQVEEVARAETVVRKNRIGLMLDIKRLLGPENWAKLEAEMGGHPRHFRIERRIGPGGERKP